MRGEPVSELVNERALFAPRPDDAFDLAAPEPIVADVRTRPPATMARLQRQALPSLHLARSRLVAAVTLEWERGVLFLLTPLVMIAGLLAYLALPVEPPLAALGVTLAITAALAYAARGRPKLSLVLLAFLVFCLGATCARVETWRASTRMLGSEITTRLTGHVVDTDKLANGRTRLTIDVISTERPKLRFAPDRVRVSAASVPENIVAGSVVVGVARLFPPSGPLRPDSYDFSFESYFDRIGANGFFFARPQLVTGEAGSGFVADTRHAIDNFRNRVANRIRDRIDGPEGEIAAALVVGVRAGIPEPVNEALRRTGLAHILSISGLHMALVAASIMGVLRLLLALFPDFASRHAVKKFAAGTALAAVGAYLLVSGGEVAAQRSFIMLSVMLIAVMFDRAALTMRNLAIAALAVIVVSPHEVVGPSFQMSFAATAALIGGYSAWSTRGNQPRAYVVQSLPRLVATKSVRLVLGIAATAIIAGLATTIFGAWHFQRVSPFSLFANLIVTPIISGVMWSAVFAAALMPFGLDGPFLSIMGAGLGWMLSIADWLSARSPVDAIGLVPVSAVILLTLALLIATLTTTWLRLAALPFAAFGLLALLDRPVPDMLISEDGRLVGVRTGSGMLAVNRARPNGFTVEDWQRATNAGAIVKPVTDGSPSIGDEAFRCADGACVLTHPTGAMIVHAETAAAGSRYCGASALIIIQDPAAGRVCAGGAARVITAREVALRGTAMVQLERNAEGPAAQIRFALEQQYRPWHEHRAFSRAARGLATRQPKESEAR